MHSARVKWTTILPLCCTARSCAYPPISSWATHHLLQRPVGDGVGTQNGDASSPANEAKAWRPEPDCTAMSLCKRQTGQFSPFYSGPYRVLDRSDRVITIDNEGVISNSRTKPAFITSDHANPTPAAQNESYVEYF
ncbi:hypothetical protein T09_13766 [Trichinella sp. T9]|nr:hypothetical protein T09_13766 [Trichinella sp. T9]